MVETTAPAQLLWPPRDFQGEDSARPELCPQTPDRVRGCHPGSLCTTQVAFSNTEAIQAGILTSVSLTDSSVLSCHKPTGISYHSLAKKQVEV